MADTSTMKEPEKAKTQPKRIVAEGGHREAVLSAMAANQTTDSENAERKEKTKALR